MAKGIGSTECRSSLVVVCFCARGLLGAWTRVFGVWASARADTHQTCQDTPVTWSKQTWSEVVLVNLWSLVRAVSRSS